MAQEAQGQTDAQPQKGQGDYDQVLNTLQQMARKPTPPPAPGVRGRRRPGRLRHHSGRRQLSD